MKFINFDQKVLDDIWKRARVSIYRADESIIDNAYRNSCQTYDPSLGINIIFTRDKGLVEGGNFKHLQNQKSLHMSISFRDPKTKEPIKHKKKWADLIAFSIFRLSKSKDMFKLWVHPPISEDGLKFDAWHYYLCCDDNWEPIVNLKDVVCQELIAGGFRPWKPKTKRAYG